jgi:hypothetical protein
MSEHTLPDAKWGKLREQDDVVVQLDAAWLESVLASRRERVRRLDIPSDVEQRLLSSASFPHLPITHSSSPSAVAQPGPTASALASSASMGSTSASVLAPAGDDASPEVAVAVVLPVAHHVERRLQSESAGRLLGREWRWRAKTVPTEACVELRVRSAHVLRCVVLHFGFAMEGSPWTAFHLYADFLPLTHSEHLRNAGEDDQSAVAQTDVQATAATSPSQSTPTAAAPLARACSYQPLCDRDIAADMVPGPQDQHMQRYKFALDVNVAAAVLRVRLRYTDARCLNPLRRLRFDLHGLPFVGSPEHTLQRADLDQVLFREETQRRLLLAVQSPDTSASLRHMLLRVLKVVMCSGRTGACGRSWGVECGCVHTVTCRNA